MKCPYCNNKLIEYKNPTTFERLYYCGEAECGKTYMMLGSKQMWRAIAENVQATETTM
jgi:hypothetical protein